MQNTLVLTTRPDDGPRAAGWLAHELATTDTARALARRLVTRLESEWGDLVGRLYPRERDGQMVMLTVREEAGRLAVTLSGEGTAPSRDPIRGEIEGLRELEITGREG